MSDSELDAAPARGRARLAAALIVAGLCAWWFVFGLPLTGADTWPILYQAGAVLDDPGLLLRERYLEGVWDGGIFWRPAFVGYFSLHLAAFGEAPLPYHVVRFLLYFLVASLCGELASRRGGSPRFAWVLAAAFYLFHPVQADYLPSVARTSHVLSDLAVVATIALLARPRGGSLVGGLAVALFAPGLNESGLIAPVVGGLVLEPWRAGNGRRQRLVAAGVLAVGLGIHALVRFRLLGSLGHYSDAEPLDLAQNLAVIASSWTDWSTGPVAIAVLVLLAGGFAALVWIRADTPAAPGEWRRVRRGSVGWLLFATAASATASRIVPRHAAIFLAPSAVLIGALVGALVASRTTAPVPILARRAGLACVAIALALILVPRSPLWRRYPQWEVVGRTTELILEASAAALDAGLSTGRPARVAGGAYEVGAEPGDTGWIVWITPLPRSAGPSPPGFRNADIHKPMILLPYSIRAALLARGHDPSLRVLARGSTKAALESLGPVELPLPSDGPGG